MIEIPIDEFLDFHETDQRIRRKMLSIAEDDWELRQLMESGIVQEEFDKLSLQVHRS